MTTAASSRPAARDARARIDSIDVVRGAAVVLLFFNHAVVLLDQSLPTWVQVAVFRSSDVCIPMFMCISGLTMAYMLRRGGCPPAAVRRRYEQRAIPLLLVTHVLITIGIWPLYRDEHGILTLFIRRWHITDAIALCLLLGPPLILYLSDRWRLILAVVLLIACRGTTAFWHPESRIVAGFKELFFGIDDYDP